MKEQTNPILAIDDDPMVFKIIQRLTGIETVPVGKLDEAIQKKAQELQPRAVMVDVHLEDSQSGIDLIPEIRKRWSQAPIIVMTGDSRTEWIGQALAAGANDFVRKPLVKEELCARLQSRIMEMAERSQVDSCHIGDITFHQRHRYLEREGQRTYLSPIESQLLSSLLESRGMVLSKGVLKRKLWGNVMVSDNALDRRVSELRKALKDVSAAVKIKAIYGEGILLQENN